MVVSRLEVGNTEFEDFKVGIMEVVKMKVGNTEVGNTKLGKTKVSNREVDNVARTGSPDEVTRNKL